MLSTEHQHATLAAPARLVADTRLEFRHASLEHLERTLKANATRIVVDLTGTVEIDASGLGVLVLLQKRARERMVAVRLRRASLGVQQMLELTKLEYLFELED